MSNLILITGNDPIAVKNNANKIAEAEKNKHDDSFAFEVISADDESLKPEKIIEELIINISTPSFFGDVKTVWVKHFSHFKMLTGKERSNKKVHELFKEVIDILNASLKENTVRLIIDGPDLDKRTAFYKLCLSKGQVHEFNKIQTSDKAYQSILRKKINDYCLEESVTITNDAVDFIAESVGSDTGRLTTEIAKLISYVGDKKQITRSDCMVICTKTLDMAQWIFAESLADKNMKESFYSLKILIDILISDKRTSPELTMFYSALKKFQDILKIKKAASDFSIPDNISYNYFKNILGGTKADKNYLQQIHPYRAFMLYKQSKNFKDGEIVKIFERLLKANKELVSGNSHPRIVLENLVLEICKK